MSVRCPYCHHSIELKGVHAGKFTPKCPACHRRFMLVISGDASIPPLIGEMPVGSPAHGSIAGSTPIKATTAPQATRPAAATVPPHASNHAGPSVPFNDAQPASRTIAKEAYVAPSNGGLTGNLGGYQIVRKLGEGGMGAVYLARQVSLDRNVALKVLSPQLAADPQFVARFTREAYAAAQLSHHNVVQIHDIGVDRDFNFFSMEFVEGQTLETLVHGEGKLDPEVAVGYVLQAARGLRFAHEHGLIHRDVKPDNLLLNEQGIVKVADLGLVKQAGKSEITQSPDAPHDAAPGQTQLNISMGTPAYMPPEQARDAAHVDQRADVYSLGCTLYDLLTGAPPFKGQTAVEMISKHQTEAIVPPDRVSRHVSPELSAVVTKMMAKRPQDRFANMTEVVETLERILGVESGKAFSPKEEHVRVLESSVDAFNRSKPATLRSYTLIGFFSACVAGAVICAIPQIGKPLLAGGLIGLVVLTTLFYQLLIGVTRKTHLFTRVRQFAFGARLADWAKIGAGLVIVVLLLFAFDLHWIWLGFAVVSALLAAVFHFTMDRAAARDRARPLEQIEMMLKSMRLRGLDETSLRQFVCKYSGDRWEEIYESLFGYEAKRAARRSWGKSERGRNRRTFAAWRDMLIDWIDRREIARREERERRLLARLQARALAAKGMDKASANRQAKKAADRMVSKASEVKAESNKRMMMTAMPTASGRTAMFDGSKSLASIAEGFTDEKHIKPALDGDERIHESYFKRRFGSPIDFILGPQIRVLIAAVLIGLFALWFKQSGVAISVEGGDIASVTDVVDKVKSGNIDKIADVKSNVKMTKSKPWSLPGVPQSICDVAGSVNGGIAGALLLFSGFFTGKRLGLTMIAATIVVLFAHHTEIPHVHGNALIAAGIGVAMGLAGIVMFRRTTSD